MQTFESWNRADSSRPRAVIAPDSPERLREAILNHAGCPSPVRAAGELHSTTACFAADGGTQVLMRGFDEVAVDAAAGRITVGAGVTMLRIREALRENGLRLQLAVAPEIGNATAGSVACSGTKDSTLDPLRARDLAQIGSLVRAVEMIDARGARLRVDGAGAVDLETGQRVPGLDLALVRSSYGLLGIIYRVTLETSPLIPLRNRFDTVALSRGEPGDRRVTPITDVFAGADAVLGFLGPYQGEEARRGKILVERRVIRPVDEVPAEADRIKRAARDWVWEWGGHLLPTLVTGLTKALRDRGHTTEAIASVVSGVLGDLAQALVDSPLARLGVPIPAGLAGILDAKALTLRALEGAFRLRADHRNDPLAGLAAAIELLGVTPDRRRPRWVLDLLDRLPGPALGALGNYLAYRSDSLVDFSRDRTTFFDFTFWAFPQSTWEDVVDAYLTFCDDHERETGFRPTLFTEVYFICRDDTSFLSFSPNEPVFTLDIVDNEQENPAWRAMCRAYNRWAAEHGGRPLFNQTKHLDTTPDVRALMRRVYGPALWARYSDAVWAANAPLPGAPDGRFVNRYFATLLDPRPGGRG